MIESFRNQRRPLAPDESLPAGTPLAALKKPADFFDRGLMEPAGLVFGFLEDSGAFLSREAVRPDGKGTTVQVDIRRRTLDELRAAGYELFVPTGDLFASDAAENIRRARTAKGGFLADMRDFSPLGDDFVYECMTGRPMKEYLRSNPHVGKQLRVGFSVREVLTHFQFLRKRLEAEREPAKAAKVQEMLEIAEKLGEMFNMTLYNSAICLGSDSVANFSAFEGRGDTRGKCELRLRDMQGFAREGDVSSVVYPSAAWFGDTRKRLRARNRALHLLQQRPDFSLLNNNSEHFCYLCCKGKSKSPQKRKLILNPVKMFQPGLSWFRPIKKITTIVKSAWCVYKLVSLLKDYKQGKN